MNPAVSERPYIIIDSSDDEEDPLFVNPPQRNPKSKVQIDPTTGRKFAGSRRLMRYQERQVLSPYEQDQVALQSITANPALSNKCFEEMRLECYTQTAVAGGGRPQPVNPNTPRSVIPPMFNAFRDNGGLLSEDVEMTVTEPVCENQAGSSLAIKS